MSNGNPLICLFAGIGDLRNSEKPETMPGMADILELVRRDIQGKRGRLSAVAKAADVPISTLHEIVFYGKSNPQKKTLDKLTRHYARAKRA